ncbi:virulence factor TspB C-terminal domain-related protein [Pseudomonas fluvialis]|uniref:virulence factor TspB C-terminal domain-related protein n=1 Tax=Pseudomonas fluvialis TaxID=1793966 RepID=UPI0012FE947F|nr:virulence factor TspB C-terminal domain-related protein [Pseudomonas pharmacofabricae]
MRVFFFILLLPCAAFASRPVTNDITGPDVFYVNSTEACTAVIPNLQKVINGLSVTHTFEGVSDGSCIYRYERSDGMKGSSAASSSDGVSSRVRYGDACVSGKPDSVTWPFGMRDPATGEVPQSSAILPPWPLCSAGCSVESSSPPVNSCFSFPDDGNPHQVFCEWNAQQTGSTCSTGDSPVPPTLPPCPPGYSSGESGCTKDDTGGGDTGGGDTGGGDTGGGDTGGGDTGGGDTGGGDTGGGDTGGGDTGGGDTGGGDTPGGEVSGLLCTQQFSCTGDAIACAQARIAKEQFCNSEYREVFDKEVKDDIGKFFQHPDFKGQDDELINVGELFNQGTRFLPSSGCPQPKVVNLRSFGGHSFQFEFDPLCQFATDLSYLIVVAAGVFFAVYVGRAFGGQ